jgi:hypothetical protein
MLVRVVDGSIQLIPDARLGLASPLAREPVLTPATAADERPLPGRAAGTGRSGQSQQTTFTPSALLVNGIQEVRAGVSQGEEQAHVEHLGVHWRRRWEGFESVHQWQEVVA